MRKTHAAGKIIAVVAVITVVGIGLESRVSAQGRSYSVARRIEAMERQADKYERDGLHRDAENKNEKAADRKRTKAIAAQVTEDFDRIQVIYNDVLRTMSAGKSFEQGFLSESVAGINRCASRLKTNLALPQSTEAGKNEQSQTGIGPDHLKVSVAALLKHISNFVTNPLFESAGVLDVELSTRASRDLNEIIELSGRLKKTVTKLKLSQ
ncbi:MAG: hypothetical protein ACRD8U_18675 [Pyrinomonadaceae bacterium]